MGKRKPNGRGRGRLVVVSTSAVEGVEIECGGCGGRVVMRWKAPPPFGDGLTCPHCGSEAISEDALLVLRSARLFLRKDRQPLALRIRTATV